jgi:diphthamide biosynthesis protein 3
MAPVPPLADELSARVRALRQIQLAELPAARRKLAATAAQVVALRAGVLERSVVILERAKYGALARATRAKAEHLAIVAQGVEGKLEYVLACFFNIWGCLEWC